MYCCSLVQLWIRFLKPPAFYSPSISLKACTRKTGYGNYFPQDPMAAVIMISTPVYIVIVSMLCSRDNLTG